MSFYMPVRYFFGKEIIKNNSDRFLKYESNILIITGKSSHKNGSLEDIKDVLTKNNKTFFVFDEIEHNPPTVLLDKIKNGFEKKEIRTIIGIGGGSPIDIAKAVSLMLANSIAGSDIYKPELIKKNIPIIAIPTTSGTGTEVTPFTVINDSSRGIKAGITSDLIFPHMAFLDPSYTLSMPWTVTRDTAIDALSHLLEGLFSKNRERTIYPLIYEGCRDIIDNLLFLKEEPDNYYYRCKIMRASLYGGIAIAQTGTTLQHSIGYPLTYNAGITHGYANGMVFPYIIELYGEKVREEILKVIKCAGLNNLNDFYEWLEKTGIEFKCSELCEREIEQFAKTAFSARNMANNPKEVNLEEVAGIYRKLLV